MALIERGRAGVKTELRADSVFGLVTQDALSPTHSPDGLLSADGNTAYGLRFTLTARFAQTASGITTVNHASSNAPWKFRILGGDVECLQDARHRSEWGAGRSSVNVVAGSTNTIASLNVTGMKQGEIKPLKINTLGNEVVAKDGSLSVVTVSVLPEVATSSTWELLVKLYCLRVT